jgi:hypothetical protein
MSDRITGEHYTLEERVERLEYDNRIWRWWLLLLTVGVLVYEGLVR